MDFYGAHRHPPPFEKSALIRPGLFSLYYIFSHPAAALSETALHTKKGKVVAINLGKNGYMVTMIAGKEPTIVKDGNCLPSSEK